MMSTARAAVSVETTRIVMMSAQASLGKEIMRCLSKIMLETQINGITPKLSESDMVDRSRRRP